MLSVFESDCLVDELVFSRSAALDRAKAEAIELGISATDIDLKIEYLQSEGLTEAEIADILPRWAAYRAERQPKPIEWDVQEVALVEPDDGSNPFAAVWNFAAPLFEDLVDHTIRQLKRLASFRGIPNYSRMNKSQLITALS